MILTSKGRGLETTVIASQRQEQPMFYRVTLPYPPSMNKYWRMYRGRMLLSEKARAYKQTAAIIARAAGVRPLAGDVKLIIDVYRKRRAGDLDNTLKGVLDCLRGIAYADDAQVSGIDARRHEDKDNPRVEVRIAPATAATAAQERT